MPISRVRSGYGVRRSCLRSDDAGTVILARSAISARCRENGNERCSVTFPSELLVDDRLERP